MHNRAAQKNRLKPARIHRVRATDITVFPIAMVTVLTVVLVLLMLLAAHR